MDSIYRQTAILGKRYGASKIVLFGSRARGDNRERSDIDIAVFSMPDDNKPLFENEIGALPTLIDFDIVFVNQNTDENLLKNIEKDGIILMSKFEEKYSKFCDAIKRLEEAVSDFENTALSSVRDGTIQRFEFCTELAWKTVRECLAEQGFIELNSPKEVMKKAYEYKLIDNDTLWIEILNSRNLTSHVYDEATAAMIFDNIKNKYLDEMKQLCGRLSK